MDILIYDIETVKGYFLYCALNPKTKEKHQFSINQYQNDLYKLIQHLESIEDYYFVGYNNLTFDNQVIEWIWRNYKDWYNYNGREIAALISQFAGDVISDT